MSAIEDWEQRVAAHQAQSQKIRPALGGDPGSGYPHQLRRRQRVVVDLSAEDGVEPCIFGPACHDLYVMRTPAYPGNHPECQSIGHVLSFRTKPYMKRLLPGVSDPEASAQTLSLFRLPRPWRHGPPA